MKKVIFGILMALPLINATTVKAEIAQKIVCEADCQSKGMRSVLVYAEGEDAVATFSNIEQQCQQIADQAKKNGKFFTTYDLRIHNPIPGGGVQYSSIQNSCFLVSSLQNR